MKVCSAVMLLIIVGFAMPSPSKAQVSVYAEGTASNLPNGPAGDYLYGGTLGVTYDGPTLMKHVLLSADIQTRYVDKDGERLIGALLGPRFSFPLKKIRVTPSGEFLVGFARYRDTTLPGALPAIACGRRPHPHPADCRRTGQQQPESAGQKSNTAVVREASA